MGKEVTEEDKKWLRNHARRVKYFQTKRKKIKMDDGTVLRVGIDTY